MPQVEKILRDIQGPALAIILERLKPFGSSQGVYFLALWCFAYNTLD